MHRWRICASGRDSGRPGRSRNISPPKLDAVKRYADMLFTSDVDPLSAVVVAGFALADERTRAVPAWIGTAGPGSTVTDGVASPLAPTAQMRHPQAGGFSDDTCK